MKASMYGPWCSIVQRPHHLARLLSRQCSALDVYTVKRHRYNCPELDFEYKLHKRTQAPGPLNRIKLMEPYVSRYDAMLEQQMCARFFESNSDISIYYGRPRDLSAHEKVSGTLVYDCVDDFEGFEGRLDPNFHRWEMELCERADYIWVVSKRLQEKLAEYEHKVRYVPNGVSYEHFAKAAPLRLQRQQATDASPCLIYVGAIYNWFDSRLVAELANLLPDWRIQLIGPVELSKQVLSQMNQPNVSLLGVRDYQSLPTILAQADVAMIPFQLNRLTEATSPIKLFEYLASGLPVVTTPMKEVLPFQEMGVVQCEDSPAAFADAVRNMREHANADRCQAIASSSSWQERFSSVLGELGIG